jgi:hypothetical protein
VLPPVQMRGLASPSAGDDVGSRRSMPSPARARAPPSRRGRDELDAALVRRLHALASSSEALVGGPRELALSLDSRYASTLMAAALGFVLHLV